MKKVDAIFLTAIVLTAIVSIGAVNASPAEPNLTEPKETVFEPTTAPTVAETTEPTQEPTETTQHVTEATEPPETEPEDTTPPVILYDVPLAEDLQLHIIGQAEAHGVDPSIIFAMIWKESKFNPYSIGDNGNSFGLMQIQPRWHGGLMAQLGCPDLLDPFQNVTVGINILGSHLERYDGNVEMALVSYNCGATGAYNNYFSQGVYSSKYSQAVLAKAEELGGETYAVQ